MKKLALASAAAFALLGSGAANAAVKDKPSFKVGGLVVVWGASTDAGGVTTQNVVSDFYLMPNTGSVATDLIGGATDVDGTYNPTVTGNLDIITGDVAGASQSNGADGVLDATDSFASFQLDATTDVNDNVVERSGLEGQFYVASNVRFGIQAKLANVVDTFEDDLDANTDTLIGLKNVTFAMDIEETDGTAGSTFGLNAQLPHGTGSTTHFNSAVTHLDDLNATTDTTVYTGTRRTAKNVGAIMDQSVRFKTSYGLDTDLATAGEQPYDLSMGSGELSAEVIYTVFAP